MRKQSKPFGITKKICASVMSFSLLTSTSFAEVVTVPPDTKIYVETDEPVIGKKKYTQIGQVVRATVWRDVVVEDRTVIEAGTPVLVRVDTLKGGRIAGRKGKMTLGAYDTTGVDGATIDLGGGYYKEGKGRIALSATLAAVVFLPLIFLKGKSAELPRGTIFDAYTKRRVDVETEDLERPSRTINLSKLIASQMDVEVLYSELESAEEPEYFSFAIKAPVGNSGEFIIDVVNVAKADDALELEAEKTGTDGEIEHWNGRVKIKKLAKQFKKGINTFEIATSIEGERLSDQVVLDIQF